MRSWKTISFFQLLCWFGISSTILKTNNRRFVKTATTPRIYDQSETEKAYKTRLLWLNIIIWVMICNNMCWYECHLDLSIAIQPFYRRFQLPGRCVNEEKPFFYYTATGNNFSTDVFAVKLNVKIKCKEYFSHPTLALACRSEVKPRGTAKIFLIAQLNTTCQHTAGNRGSKTS